MRIRQKDFAVTSTDLFEVWHSASDDPDDDTDFSIVQGAVRYSGDPWAPGAGGCWKAIFDRIEVLREEFVSCA